MQFLSIAKRAAGFTDADAAPLREDENQRVRTLFAEGRLRQIWHRADAPGACILWEAESEEQVREMLASLPFAKAGMLEVTVIPLKPYGGFGPRVV